MSIATATRLMNNKGMRKMRNGPLLERIAGNVYKNILNISYQGQIDEVYLADTTLAGSTR